MPTPESAAFLARKPTVAPSFSGVDYNDTPRLKAAQDAIIREQWVRSMMARLVREELGKCYYREGIAHLEKCGKLRGKLILLYLPPSSLYPSFRGVAGRAFGEKTKKERRGLKWANTCVIVGGGDTERYMDLLKESRIKGYLFQQQNYLPGDENPGG